MIFVKQGHEPPIFSSAFLKAARRRTWEFYAQPPERRPQKRWGFPDVDKKNVRAALTRDFHSKCAYCETPTPKGVIEWHRPRLNATDQRGIAPDHYFWLAAEWKNARLACSACSKLKGSRFPVEGDRASPPAEWDDDAWEAMVAEVPLLLDPCTDDPELELHYDFSGRAYGSTERARRTIEIVELNRPSLVDRRHSALVEADAQFDELEARISEPNRIKKALGALDQTAAPYRGIRRQILRARAFELAARSPSHRRVLRALLDIPSALPESRTVADAMGGAQRTAALRPISSIAELNPEHCFRAQRISRVIVENVRGVESIVLNMRSEDSEMASAFLLLGENGVGKSTVLQAIALALMGAEERKRRRLTSNDMLRFDEKSGRVVVEFAERQTVELRLERDRPITTNVDEPAVMTLGYGSTRMLPRRGKQLPLTSRVARVDSIFEPDALLSDPELFFEELEPEAFRRTAVRVKELLGFGEDAEIVRGAPTTIRFGNKTLEFRQLSDGYRAALALVVDVMRFAEHVWGERIQGEYTEMGGILLVDEIETHLHPRWKMRVVEDLRRFFPRFHIIMSTHDPLCLRGLKQGEVVAMLREDDGKVQAITDLPAPESMTVDQLLTSEFFGLGTTLDPRTERQLRRYQLLAAADHVNATTKSERDELESLRPVLDRNRLLGTSPRDRLYMQVVDIALAQAKSLAPGGPATKEGTAALEKLYDEVKARAATGSEA